MDQQRKSSPKFSESLEPLSNHIKFNCESDTASTISSNISLFKGNDMYSLGFGSNKNKSSNGDLGEIAEKVSDQNDSTPKQKQPFGILKEPRKPSFTGLLDKQRNSEVRTESDVVQVTPKSILQM